ncbi:WD40 repeat-like protein [Linnemannia elongata AG-77]|uniref:WD40 repeat-like protein n=1 Tax=Linnemannia elongata AG-77 TaxID=1314771 RepID=A0A197JCS2_9FUNG|nr:WD40 repeat-like protein [Linnemannia elongata AG-77]
MLAVGLDKVGLEVYDTTTWRRTHQVSVDCAVLGVAFSPDGQQVVSGGNNGAVRLWDCTNGEGIFVMEGHLKRVQCVAFSPCGKQIASASNDGTVRLWDSETGRCTFVLKGHTGHVMSVKYSVDGRQLVSGGLDATIRFWNPETGEPGVVWISSLGEVWSLAFSGDGRWIASGHEDGGLQFWHALSGEPGPVLRGHTGTVKGIAFSPDSRRIASSSEDETMRLWDASTGTLAFMTASHKDYVNDVAFSPNDLQIASGGGDGKVRLWEVDSVLSSSMEAQGQLGPVYKAVYSPNGQVILTDSGSRTVKQWDSLTGALLPLPIELPDSLSTNAVSYSLDGIPVALSIHDETIRLLEIQEGGAETGGPTHKTISCLAFSTTGDRLAVCSWNSTVWIFDSQSGGLVTSKELDQWTSVMSFSPNDQQLATASSTSEPWIHLWDLQSEKPAIELRGHTESIACIAYSPCGQWIVSSSHDKTVRLWSQQQPPGESESWSCVYTVNGFFGLVSTMAWSPTVPMEFVTGCEDQSVRVWRVSTDGEDITVKMLWGTNLGVLYAGGSVLKGTTGLSLISRHLLIQRGAIDDTLPLEDSGGLEVEELEVDSGSEECSE